jgi:3',5'-cyclic AMP phosphodiesterase CpdA
MNRVSVRSILLLFLFVVTSAVAARAQRSSDTFSFIISSDQRERAMPEFRQHQYTLGGYEAIKNVGQGSFMIVLGDMDPPSATRELIASVLGRDYLWYPVIGNHDLEVEANTEYLRTKIKGLPYIVRRGPAGCEETTYSFDWNDVHFVILNVYYDGKSDKGNDGNIVPELMTWLENDLRQNTKKRVLVFGHEPLYPFLDMDNGTVRHLNDALDKYPDDALKFHRMLVKHHVTAYFSGHTHTASYADINGLWLINSGHIYGQEEHYVPEKLFSVLAKHVEADGKSRIPSDQSILGFYKSDEKEIKKTIFNLGIVKVKTYKDLTEDQVIKVLTQLYSDCTRNADELARYTKMFWANTEWRKSTFLKVSVGPQTGSVEIYRDKDFTGDYGLRDRIVLY